MCAKNHQFYKFLECVGMCASTRCINFNLPVKCTKMHQLCVNCAGVRIHRYAWKPNDRNVKSE